MKRIDSVSSAWIPEDDLLLKNSIEAGASLEVLAKGAVEFSRRYTLHELRERWHALLYDPNVSAQASARMVEFELSGSKPSSKFSVVDNSKGSENASEKRRKRSIRRQYYSMRKRIKNEFVNTPDLGFFEKCSNFQDNVTLNHEAQVDDDCLANNLGLEETDFEILRQAFPETIGTVSTTAAVDESANAFHTEGCHNPVENEYISGSMREDGLYKFTEDVPPLLRENSPGYDAAQSVSLLGDKPDGADFINSSAVPEGGYEDSLLNFSNVDDMLYMDVVAKDTMDDNTNVPEDALCSTDATPSIQFHEESKDSSFHGDQKDVCDWEVDLPSTSVSLPDSIQLTEGKIICTLNTEDPEIPCNDDIFLLIHPSTSFAPVRQQIATDSIDPLSSSADEKDGEQGLSAVKDPTQMAGPNLLSEFVSAHPRVGCGFKSESSETKCSGQVPEHDKLRNPQGLDTTAIYGEMSLRAGVGSVKMTDPQSMDNPSISDHNNSDSDGDIPYFSDIEAMILEMDLAYAQESCIASEVARYQYDDSKRMIIRLEQTACSSLQRAMSSRGALAVFYGRRLNYYIKKTEVIIGRSTGDTDVDIDLRKEGRANMISRRQATLKMESDGSFTLKNLGKSSISLNGNVIAPGQVAALGSSCLIEIRGMSFVFEINGKYVRRHLDNIIKKSQGKNTTFEWSP